METRRIEVVEYSPLWKQQYKELKEELLTVVEADIVNIFHIGSTSIEGMAAKPTIDILLEVKDVKKLDDIQAAFTKLGYISHGEYGIEGRQYYSKQEGAKHLVHLHCFSYGDKRIEEHLFFRKYLKEHKTAFEEYKNLKARNASLYKENPERYQNAKHDLIQDINQKAKQLYFFIPLLRKQDALMNYHECLNLIYSQVFGTLSITNNFPYSVPINYVYDDYTLYFHTGRAGYKLKGINQVACFNIVEDLGLKPEEITHNYRSVMIYGKLHVEKEKRNYILHKFIDNYAPNESRDCIENPYTQVLALDISYMLGKKHIK